MVPEVPLQPAGGGPTVVGTEFINVSNDDIEEVWRDHVATLLKGKSEAAAVNTMFLLNRLFLVSDPHVVLLSSADVYCSGRFMTGPFGCVCMYVCMYVCTYVCTLHTTVLYTLGIHKQLVNILCAIQLADE